MTVPLPVFVVVGNVNQGKSSIVAALTEDQGVPIDAMPGTTRTAAEYSFRIGAEVAFRVVDTPGFQRARHALQWLQAHARTAAERPAAVAAFVREFKGRPDFVDEVRLLEPIVAGGSHIYVVDASARHEPSSEAEMEILRWTGQPGMAVINRTGARDHGAEWRSVLTQFFQVVRDFDAHAATFRDRLGLLRAFREVKQDWRHAIDRVLFAMRAEWTRRGEVAVTAIAGLLVGVIGMVEKRSLGDGDDAAKVADELRAKWCKRVRDQEHAARQAVETAFGHARLARDEAAAQLLATDLFSAQSEQAFGLTREQLAVAGLKWGAVAGLAIDFVTGFTMAGAAIGTVVGGAAGYFGSQLLPKVGGDRSKLARLLFREQFGRFVAVGPVTSPQLPWSLLDRALVHLAAVRGRSHARQDTLVLGDGKQGVVA
ncbi:MAG: DUF3482 domain-containing protein, partial [Planctomycetes bacterium]|nr:DUF3482 domain-containing protein [Planctomycetota bacterium]